MQPTGDVLQVPLSLDKFRRYRNMQVVTASMGLTMTVGSCGFPALALYGMSTGPSNAGGWEVSLFLGLGLVLFIGCATVPAVQLAKILTCTLTQHLPALAMNEEGLWDYSSNYVFGFIPWCEIEDVIVTSRYAPRIRETFPGIAFVVRNNEVLLRRKPGLMGVWIKMDEEITARRQVFIPQGRMSIPVEEVLQSANDCRQRRRTIAV